MNAAVEYQAESPSDLSRRFIDRLLYQELKGTLNRWGDWIERHRRDVSLPGQSAHLNISGNEYGHRILCAEMPKKIWNVHRATLMLEGDHQWALTLWYGYQKADDGGWLNGEEKAKAAGITYQQLRNRVYAARKELLKLKCVWCV